MHRYRDLLRNPSFARLWMGSTISMFGDALTWISMVWLVFSLAGTTAAISLLVVCYTAPVIVGGFAMGAALDRLDRRHTLIVANVVLGCAIATIPLLHALHALRLVGDLCGRSPCTACSRWRTGPACQPSSPPWWSRSS